MPEAPERKWRIAVVALAFVFGVLVGGLVTSAVAARSGQVLLGAASIRFVFNQEQKVSAAWNAGEMNTALSHARCAFEAAYGDGARNFDTSDLDWSIWGGALLQKLVVQPNIENSARARPTGEAIARAKVAVVLERLGRTAEAQHELEESVRVSSLHDLAWWRDVGLKTIPLAAPAAGGRRE
jgi:hypothetical protein